MNTKKINVRANWRPVKVTEATLDFSEYISDDKDTELAWNGFLEYAETQSGWAIERVGTTEIYISFRKGE